MTTNCPVDKGCEHITSWLSFFRLVPACYVIGCTRSQGVVYIQMGNIRSRSRASHLPDVRNKLLPQ